jgi:hypothetical protein
MPCMRFLRIEAVDTVTPFSNKDRTNLGVDPRLRLEASWSGNRTAACLYGATAEAGLPVICVETRKLIANRRGQIGNPFAISRELHPSVSHALQRVVVCCNVTILRQPFALLGISPKFLLVGHTIRSLLSTPHAR